MPHDDTFENLQKNIGKKLDLEESNMGIDLHIHKGEKLDDYKGPEKLVDIFGIAST